MRFETVVLAGFLASTTLADTPKASPRDALKPLHMLVGSWKGTGTPEGTPDERQKGHWTETVAWEWQFKGTDAWLKLDIAKGKHFTGGELRSVGEEFELVLATVSKEKLTYRGKLKEKQLALERAIPDSKLVERLTFSLLHENRITYRLETRFSTGTTLSRLYLVGLTKEGVAFADIGPSERECIVSGGRGTISVSHNGKTYYVCCSGCRDEFKDSPEKYIKEWEAKRKK